MWNDIPSAELNQLMDEIDATELRPDETELERWLENSPKSGDESRSKLLLSFFRACLGVLRLAKCYSNPRLEAACRRALQAQTCSYNSLKSGNEAGERGDTGDGRERFQRNSLDLLRKNIRRG